MFGAIGVLAALRERDRVGGTGEGQEIQSALFENCCLLASQHMQQFQMTGEVPPPFPSRISAWSVYDTFTVAGGEQLFIGAVSDKQFATLCQVINRPDLANDPALVTNTQRVAVRPELLQKLGETLQHMDLETLCAQLQSAGLPYAKVVRPDELVNDEHLIASGGLVPMGTGDGETTQVVLLPLLMGGHRPGVRRPLPAIGEHTEEVLATLASATVPSSVAVSV
jgi:formyl-CoA transferase